MVTFDQLRISEDSSYMYIQIHVDDSEYFKGQYLDTLTVMTSGDVSESAYNVPTDKYIYQKKFSDGLKSATVVLEKGELDAAFLGLSSTNATATVDFKHSDFSKDLFFVYVTTTTGDIIATNECVPCGYDNITNLAVTFNEQLLYYRTMNYVKTLADTCKVPQEFIDFILLWNAFKAAVETEHWVPAIKFYNMLFGNSTDSIKTDGSHSPYGGSTSVVTTKTCKCYG